MNRTGRRLLVLALVLFAVAWVVSPAFDPERPLVSLTLALTFCGGWGSAVAGAARLCQPETSP